MYIIHKSAFVNINLNLTDLYIILYHKKRNNTYIIYILHLRCSQRPDPRFVNTENILDGCHGIIFLRNDMHLAVDFSLKIAST